MALLEPPIIIEVVELR